MDHEYKNPRKHLIKKIETKECYAHLEYYALQMPEPDEKGFYVQSVSFNAFFHSLKKHNYDEKNGLFYYSIGWDDYLFELGFKRDPELEKALASLTAEYKTFFEEAIEFNSIWDFYKHIGYDYKTKKYEL